MHAAFDPYTPLDALKPVADDVWIADGPEIGMRFGPIAMPFPTRMTLVRLPGGALWVHSPIEPDAALLDSIAALGRVAHLVAPNTLHYWWLPEWHAAFPEAVMHCPPGLAARAKRALPPHRELGAAPPADWAGAIDQVLVRGRIFTEIDFFHTASRTLILTDLIENFEPRRVRSHWLRVLLKLAGVADPDGKAPIDMQWSFWRERKAVRSAVERMIAWAPTRVILAHGRWYQRNGVAELERAFRWVL